MILSEKSPTFRDHALALALNQTGARKLPASRLDRIPAQQMPYRLPLLANGRLRPIHHDVFGLVGACGRSEQLEEIGYRSARGSWRSGGDKGFAAPQDHARTVGH